MKPAEKRKLYQDGYEAGVYSALNNQRFGFASDHKQVIGPDHFIMGYRAGWDSIKDVHADKIISFS